MDGLTDKGDEVDIVRGIDSELGGVVEAACNSGDTGIAGVSGDAGDTGIAGDAGDTGIAGVSGDAGMPGDAGDTGIAGIGFKVEVDCNSDDEGDDAVVTFN